MCDRIVRRAPENKLPATSAQTSRNWIAQPIITAIVTILVTISTAANGLNLILTNVQEYGCRSEIHQNKTKSQRDRHERGTTYSQKNCLAVAHF